VAAPFWFFGLFFLAIFIMKVMFKPELSDILFLVVSLIIFLGGFILIKKSRIPSK